VDGEHIDSMDIAISAINMKTDINGFNSNILKDTNIELYFQRPISENKTHLIPDIKVETSTSRYEYLFSVSWVQSFLLLTLGSQKNKFDFFSLF